MTLEIPELLFTGHEREFMGWWFDHLTADQGLLSAKAIAAAPLIVSARTVERRSGGADRE